MKRVPCILCIFTAFTNATLFLFLFYFTEAYFTPTDYLKVFLTAAYFNGCNHHTAYFSQHLCFLFFFCHITTYSQSWQSHGRRFSGRQPLVKLCAVLLAATTKYPGLSCAHLMVFLNFCCCFFAQPPLCLKQRMFKAEYGYHKSCINQTIFYTGIINWI